MANLFLSKALFTLGNYRAAINELSRVDVSPDEIVEKDALLYRCYIASGEVEIVLNEVNSNSPLPLQALKVLAKYENGDDVTNDLHEFETDGLIDRPYFSLVAALVYFKEGMLDDCYRRLKHIPGLEGSSLLVQYFITINRYDLAENAVLEMQKISDPAIETRLSAAWLAICLGGEEMYDLAMSTFQELLGKYGESPILLNGIAVTFMHLGEYEKAKEALMDALEKNPNSADFLVNSIVCSKFLDSSTSRNMTSLQKLHPNHPWLQQQDAMDKLFDECAQDFAIKTQ
eukprot:TRINITY_DN4927_c0_g1_i1.p1 TRINITY_DN4927_c0_g1~~TRINITY_DN4927_c0_g1_i1.p1  ORF type:complete len:287 (-),score=65.15 TRINITY_DN4927_c0_g1_i1:144-1004(-)